MLDQQIGEPVRSEFEQGGVGDLGGATWHWDRLAQDIQGAGDPGTSRLQPIGSFGRSRSERQSPVRPEDLKRIMLLEQFQPP